MKDKALNFITNCYAFKLVIQVFALIKKKDKCFLLGTKFSFSS